MLEKPKRTQLNRALSKLGLCSRTVGEEKIRLGQVSVNGDVIRDPDFWISLGVDKVSLNESVSSKTITQNDLVYFALHKPAGFVTTRQDELGRKTIYDLVPEKISSWIFPVGRLDLESEGLLFLTNDGEWSNLLTDPDFHLEKEYRVKVDGILAPESEDIFRNGIELQGSKTFPAKLAADGKNWYRVILEEGRNRQIRRMFHSLGFKVKKLIRLRIGSFLLGDLKSGEILPLDFTTVSKLRSEAELGKLLRNKN